MKEYTVHICLTEEQQERLERDCRLLGNDTPEDLLKFIMSIGSAHWVEQQMNFLESQEPLRSRLNDQRQEDAK